MIRQFTTKRDIVSAFANTMNLVSPELQDHHEKVSYLAYRLAQTLDMDEKHRIMAFERLCSREAVGMSEDECKMMRIAGYLHDLGKMKIPDEIPDKPGRLTEAVYLSRYRRAPLP